MHAHSNTYIPAVFQHQLLRVGTPPGWEGIEPSQLSQILRERTDWKQGETARWHRTEQRETAVLAISPEACVWGSDFLV